MKNAAQRVAYRYKQIRKQSERQKERENPGARADILSERGFQIVLHHMRFDVLQFISVLYTHILNNDVDESPIPPTNSSRSNANKHGIMGIST